MPPSQLNRVMFWGKVPSLSRRVKGTDCQRDSSLMLTSIRLLSDAGAVVTHTHMSGTLLCLWWALPKLARS